MTTKLHAILAIAGIACLVASITTSANAASQNQPWNADISNLQTLLQTQIGTVQNQLNSMTNSFQTFQTQTQNDIGGLKTQQSTLSGQLSSIQNQLSNPPPLTGGFNGFLKLDGIQGSSTDKNHPGEIEIDSYSFGVTQTGTSGTGGGGGAGKATVHDITITGKLDKSSPKLFLAAVTGEHIKSATLTLRKAGSNPVEYLKIELTDVLISSYQTEGTGTEVPTESISLNFAKILITYIPQNSDGTSGAPIAGGWDVLAGNKI